MIEMLWNHFIISFRRVKKHTGYYLLAVTLQTIGFIGLLNNFLMYRIYGQLSLIMIISALIIFALSRVGGINSRNTMTEFSVRKLLGATSRNIYTLLVIESLHISVTAALLSLIILDLNVFDEAVSIRSYFNPPDIINLIFLVTSIFVVSILTGLIPAYRLSKIDLAQR